MYFMELWNSAEGQKLYLIVILAPASCNQKVKGDNSWKVQHKIQGNFFQTITFHRVTWIQFSQIVFKQPCVSKSLILISFGSDSLKHTKIVFLLREGIKSKHWTDIAILLTTDIINKINKNPPNQATLPLLTISQKSLCSEESMGKPISSIIWRIHE